MQIRKLALLLVFFLLLSLLSYFPTVKAVAISRVQGNARGTSTYSSSVVATMGSNPTSGNVMVATIGVGSYGASAVTVSSITETKVTWTYQIRENYVNASSGWNTDVEIWYGVVTDAGASKTVTATLSSSSVDRAIINVCEYTGMLTDAFLDQTATNEGFGTSLDTGTTGNTAQANELWIGANAVRANAALTDATNGFTLLDGAGAASLSAAYLEKIVSTTGTANTGCTAASKGNWEGVIATFKGSDTGGGQNLNFNLTAVPVITATLGRGIEIFQALSGAPAFTSSITYGLECFFNLSEIPVTTASLVYGRALAFGLSEIPKFIADLAYEFQLKAGKNLYFNLSIIPQFIVDMTVQKGKELTFNLSIIGAFITDLAKNQEIFRSLSETPKFIVDMTREIELAFVEFVLLEVPIFTATLGFLAETGMTTSDLANGAIALALIALIFALCGIGLAVKKAKD